MTGSERYQVVVRIGRKHVLERLCCGVLIFTGQGGQTDVVVGKRFLTGGDKGPEGLLRLLVKPEFVIDNAQVVIE